MYHAVIVSENGEAEVSSFKEQRDLNEFINEMTGSGGYLLDEQTTSVLTFSRELFEKQNPVRNFPVDQ